MEIPDFKELGPSSQRIQSHERKTALGVFVRIPFEFLLLKPRKHPRHLGTIALDIRQHPGQTRVNARPSALIADQEPPLIAHAFRWHLLKRCAAPS